MRDAAEEAGSGASSATEPSKAMSGSEDNRRLFMDLLFLMTSYDGEVSLSEFDEVDFRRVGCGMAAGSENRAGT